MIINTKRLSYGQLISLTQAVAFYTYFNDTSIAGDNPCDTDYMEELRDNLVYILTHGRPHEVISDCGASHTREEWVLGNTAWMANIYRIFYSAELEEPYLHPTKEFGDLMYNQKGIGALPYKDIQTLAGAFWQEMYNWSKTEDFLRFQGEFESEGV